MNNIFKKTVLLLAGAMMAACSSDDDMVEGGLNQDGALMRTPVTISANYGEGTKATTRVAYEETGNKISATWQSGDKLLVVVDGQVSTLTLSSGAGTTSATFTGTILHTNDLTPTTQLICYVKDQNNQAAVSVHEDGSYTYTDGTLTSQDGTVGGAASCNVYYGVTHYGDGTNISCNFSVNTSIMKFTVDAPGLTEGQATLSYKSEGATIAAATFDIAADGTNTVYLAIPAMHLSGAQTLEYKTGDDANASVTATAILSETQANFTAGQTYSKRIMVISPATGEITVPDGVILCGTGGGRHRTETNEWVGTLTRVTIADGATVTFNNLTIAPPYESQYEYKYAGITCAGNATINLRGTNIVQANERTEPGIFIPANHTLTIQGTGSLTAKGDCEGSVGGGAGIGGYYIYGEEYGIGCGHIVINSGTVTAYGNAGCAGIGGGRRASCDGITINGGTVTATGDGEAAGIGSGQLGSCGNITINGGTVTATGGYSSAGIGSGNEGSCGNITIATGITSVTAMQGMKIEGSTDPIGKGFRATGLGTVTFGGVTVFDGDDWNGPYTDEDYGGLTLSITEVDVDDNPDSEDWRTVWMLSHETE